MKHVSDINGWPFVLVAHERCADHHPGGHGETYLCPYQPDTDGHRPCNVKPSKPCLYNPQHLPNTKKENSHE